MPDASLPERFPGHYRPTEAEFERLWNEGVFVLDANVMLNAYRYSRATREELFQILERVMSTIASGSLIRRPKRFEENRLEVIQSQREVFLQFETELESAKSRLVAQAKGLKRHSVLDAEELEEHVTQGFQALERGGHASG